MTSDHPAMAESRNKLLHHLSPAIQQRYFIVVFSLSAALMSFALTYAFSEKFQAATTIFFRAREMSLLRQRETEAFGAPVPKVPFEVIEKTLSDAVKNVVILRPVVKAFHLDEQIEVDQPNWYGRWYHNTKAWVKEQLSNLWMLLKFGRIIEDDPTLEAMQNLAENISITSSKDSFIYLLELKDKNPQRARSIVDMVGEKLVNWLASEYKDPGEIRLMQLHEQLVIKDSQINSLRKEIETLLTANKVVLIPDEISKALKNLYELKLHKIQVDAQIQEKLSIISELESKIQSPGPLGKHIQAEDFSRMRSNRLFNGIELEGLKSRQQDLGRSISTIEDRMEGMPSVQYRLDMLNMKIESLRREYEQLDDLYLEVHAEVSASPTEIRLLHPAVVSEKPVQPIKIYHVGLSLFLALSFSVGLVYVFDFFDIQAFRLDQEGTRRTRRRRGGWASYSITLGVGAAVAGAVFYLLKKLGF